MPAPSPMTNPSRSLSNGREAFSGSSLRVESALAEQKPAMPSGVMAASLPPVRITSAAPDRMVVKAMPMEWLLEAQAVVAQRFGP